MRKLIYGILFVACAWVIVACGPTATPEVIRDMSRYETLTAIALPTKTRTGPTYTPSMTSTAYIPPTENTTLPLDTVIVRVGNETITLAQFRQRVRYERYVALAGGVRLINSVGLAGLNFTVPGKNPSADQLASVFNTLANSDAFGHQIYNVMLRESILRQEFKTRGLKIDPADIRGYWIRQLDLQTTSDVDKILAAAEDKYITTAIAYSGISREAINQIAEAYVIGTTLRPLIANENVTPIPAITFKLRHILTKTETEARAAVAAINGGADFRSVACQYSVDPAVQGSQGKLGYVSGTDVVPGLKDSSKVIDANTGDYVGPLQSPAGWHIFRINNKRQNVDGDMQVDVQAITVATESLAVDLLNRVKGGEDFGRLVCQYSLDTNAGNGGDLGYVNAETLAPEVSRAVQSSKSNGLIGPIATSKGFEVIFIDDHKIKVPQPADLDQAKSIAFNTWQENKINSDFVMPLSDVWKNAIPADPLPRDVSPLMREENFGLPTPGPTQTFTPTPAHP